MKQINDFINEKLHLSKDTKIVKQSKDKCFLILPPTLKNLKRIKDCEKFDDRYFINKTFDTYVCLTQKEAKMIYRKIDEEIVNYLFYHMFDEKTFTLDQIDEYKQQYNKNFRESDLEQFSLQEKYKILGII